MQASMLEIYNEEYKDLLSKRSKPAQGAKDSQAGDGKKHLLRWMGRQRGQCSGEAKRLSNSS